MLIPIRDNRRPPGMMPVTTALVTLTSLIFLLQLGAGLHLTVWQGGVIPWELIHAQGVELPSRLAPALTLVVSLFLHGGVLHLAGNMLYLWVFGPSLERGLGRFRFAALYLTAGIGGMVAHAVTNPTSVVPAVGASGAVAGVLGAYLVLYPRGRIRSVLLLIVFVTLVELPALVVIGMWAVFQAFGALLSDPGSSSVAVFAHLGGFVIGCAITGRLRSIP